MHDTFSRSFGIVIAFLLPGIVGLYAASFFSPEIDNWFKVAATQDSSFGGFSFVILGSLGVGIFVSGVRWLLIDRLFPKPPRLDHAQRRDTDTEHVYQDIRSQHYHFYQFYSNTLCALVLLYLSWLAASHPPMKRAVWMFAALVIVNGVLFVSARDALQKFDAKVAKLLPVHRTKESA
jgi:hypothetical protein